MVIEDIKIGIRIDLEEEELEKEIIEIDLILENMMILDLQEILEERDKIILDHKDQEIVIETFLLDIKEDMNMNLLKCEDKDKEIVVENQIYQ